MLGAYYNENDSFAAAWLRELIKANLIAQGDVDERSIVDVAPSDLRGYVQCHFFAGIGGWSYALRLAGWPDDQPVWTGSCPCQPFSEAGKRLGIADERHLWPAFYWLIEQSQPPKVIGEQVASPDGKVWLAGVQSDLEQTGYRFASANLCAAGISAPHNRSRYFFVADSPSEGLFPTTSTGIHSSQEVSRSRDVESTGLRSAPTLSMANTNGHHEHWWSGPLQVGWNAIEGEVERRGRRYRAQWRIKPGLPIVANGVRNRVGKLCGFGNAIVPQVAAEFIASYLDVTEGSRC